MNTAVEYRVYDGLIIPYPARSFDMAYAICVLHHVPVDGWANFAAEMKRVLRPGGLALVFEHNPRHPLTLKAVRDCPFDRDAVLVLPERAVALYEGAYFSRLSVEHILTIPAVAGAPKAVDRFLSRFGMGAQYCLAATA
jgi:SAM-dependent methyltransferase